MIVFLFLALFFIAGASIPAVKLTKKYKKIKIWDYTYPFLSIPIWFFLTVLDVGAAVSLSNFIIENFWISVVSILTPWVIYLLYRLNNKIAGMVAKILTLLPISFTVILRLLMESLPE